MSKVIKRTVTLVKPHDKRNLTPDPLRLRDLETSYGYVLLGEPGMGKSTELQQEAKRIKNSTFLTARHFLSYNIENYSQWRVGPLFIDGLDEVRATEPKTILHEIAFRLKSLA